MPVRSACDSAASTDCAAYMPVVKSTSGTGTRSGGRRAAGDDISPSAACRLGSIARPSRRGPAGDRAPHEPSGCRPARVEPARAPEVLDDDVGRSASRRASSRIDDDAALAAVERVEERALPSSTKGGNSREGSPRGGSTLTTSAPRSLQRQPAERRREELANSTTRTPSRSCGSGSGVALRGAIARLRGLDLAVLRRRVRHEGVDSLDVAVATARPRARTPHRSPATALSSR